MKTKSKQLVDYAYKIISISTCLLLITISNNKIANYFHSKVKRKQSQSETLGLKDIQIKELGQKFLKSYQS